MINIHCRSNSNSVIFNRISSIFHIWIASIYLSFKFEYGFRPTSDNKDGRQNGCHLSISAVAVTLTVIFNRISSIFHIWSASIYLSFKFEYGFSPTSDNKDGRQNGPPKWPPPINICYRGHFNSAIFNQSSSIFHIWIASIYLSFKFEYGFSPTSDNKDGRQNGRHLSISAFEDTLTQPFLIGVLPNFIIYELLLATFHSSFNMGFIRHPITKMADKMATAFRCLLSWSFFIGFLSKFHI